jgi:hypothetical protein
VSQEHGAQPAGLVNSERRFAFHPLMPFVDRAVMGGFHPFADLQAGGVDNVEDLGGYLGSVRHLGASVPAVTAHAVLGYDACRRCPEHWVEHAFWVRTGGLCEECFVVNNREPLRQLEIVSRAGVVAMPIGRKKRYKQRKTRREKDAEKAKLAAMRRLAAIFPDFYAMLLAEERVERDLSPRPKNAAPLGHEDPTGEQTRAFLDVYHRLEAMGERL